MVEGEVCEACRWWEPLVGDVQPARRGVCTRFPPTTYRHLGRDDPADPSNWLQPMTSPFDSCGEHAFVEKGGAA